MYLKIISLHLASLFFISFGRVLIFLFRHDFVVLPCVTKRMIATGVNPFFLYGTLINILMCKNPLNFIVSILLSGLK